MFADPVEFFFFISNTEWIHDHFIERKENFIYNSLNICYFVDDFHAKKIYLLPDGTVIIDIYFYYFAKYVFMFYWTNYETKDFIYSSSKM